RRQRRLQSGIVARAIEGLDASLGAARRSTDLDALRGHEGLAARAYFEGLGAAIRNPAFTFAGRSRRPPRDPVNACLSFGYTLLVIRVEHAVRATGLDASLGVLHEPNRAAPALALDLAEEARVLVDDLVLTLINRQQLQVDDFRNPPEDEVGPGMEGAVYMGKVGKTILTRAWERRIREVDTHPISHQGWPLMSLFQEQARQIARVARGEADTYVPLLWEAR
ncbi:MAG: CRISPR-associated endonuclease Cas1, partial [Myxococcales bacterium]|nr:CRISPR-associated endonuclease Cas1 [Myxococcales bacterium]